MRRFIDTIWRKWQEREEIRYLFVGGATTLVNFALFTLMHEIMMIDLTISNVTSIAISIIFAYVANKKIVFRRRSGSQQELAVEFAKFVGSRLFTMVVEVGTVWLFAEVLLWNALLGKAISQVIVIVLNYIISKLIVFRKTDEG